MTMEGLGGAAGKRAGSEAGLRLELGAVVVLLWVWLPLEVGTGEAAVGAPRNAEDAAVALLINVEEWQGWVALMAAVGFSRGKGHGGWRLQ